MNIDDILELGRLREKSEKFKTKLDRVMQLSAEQLEKHEKPYLALSGGKDSTAMAFVVNEAASLIGKDFEVWAHISDASFPGTRETIEVVCQKINRKLVLHESPVSAFEIAAGRERRAFGKSGYFYDSIREYAKDKDLAFVGTRAFESKRRMKAAKIHGEVFYSKSMGDVTVCTPLIWFTLEDVAAILYRYNAPIHPIYSMQAIENGKNINDETQWIRLNYVTSKDLLNKGTAIFLKRNYPHLFNKLKSVYPKVGEYV